MPNELSDISVLVTRPEQRGLELCRLIEARGGRAVHLPTIEFAPPSDPDLFQQSIMSLGTQDWLIFISPQAVAASVPAIRAAWPNSPPKVKFAAVGAGTAAALKQAGYIVEACPTTDWSSGGLLALPAFQSLANQHITIVRGEGGRELLAKSLNERGAFVSHVIAYRRVVPSIKMDSYLNLIKQHQIDVVVCTSFEGVHHFKILVGEKAWPAIKALPLIVMSERIKELAHDLGFQTIWVAANASHDAILEMLAQQKDELCQSKQMK